MYQVENEARQPFPSQDKPYRTPTRPVKSNFSYKQLNRKDINSTSSWSYVMDISVWRVASAIVIKENIHVSCSLCCVCWSVLSKVSLTRILSSVRVLWKILLPTRNVLEQRWSKARAIVQHNKIPLRILSRDTKQNGKTRHKTNDHGK